MARHSKTPKTVASKVSAPKPRKPRVGNVRGLLIKALGKGSQSRADLLKATGASYNGLTLHLTQLRAEGVVSFDASNRIVTLVGPVTGTETTARTKKKVKTSVSTVTAPTPAQALAPIEATATLIPVGYSTATLQQALDRLSGRFKPAEGLDDKLMVLDYLVGHIGGPVAVVLSAIKSDLQRHSPV